ncbi:hypothetical protein E2C01_081825 [Portunus trituberculatus]|uniref:Uncharacterized protein n=1 Tax=Portunus trituberculatus TaxID=210409 RepID=A0A5B7IQT2_PORTR|nr:hypothetical protein [Portunus trituberculatus]
MKTRERGANDVFEGGENDRLSICYVTRNGHVEVTPVNIPKITPSVICSAATIPNTVKPISDQEFSTVRHQYLTSVRRALLLSHISLMAH